MKINLKTKIAFRSVRAVDKVMLAKNLAIMLKAGVSITEALAVVRDQASSKLKKILDEALESVSAGSSLSEALGRYSKVFSLYFVKMIYSGEQSGTLEESLVQVAEQLKKDYESRQKIRNAMLYPVIIFGTLIVIGSGLIFFALPKISKFFTAFKGNLPLATKILIKLGSLGTQNGLLILILLTAGIIIIWFLSRLKTFKPFFHHFLLHLPFIGQVIYQINLNRLSDLLGTLLKSGLPITEAIKITGQTLSNQVFVQTILRLEKLISQGTSLNEALTKQKKIFPLIFIRLIQSGEQSGNLEESLFSLAEYYQSEVDNKIRNLTVVLEPIFLIIVGLLVAFVALAIITPIYQLTGSIKG